MKLQIVERSVILQLLGLQMPSDRQESAGIHLLKLKHDFQMALAVDAKESKKVNLRTGPFCPDCDSVLTRKGDRFYCSKCKKHYPEAVVKATIGVTTWKTEADTGKEIDVPDEIKKVVADRLRLLDEQAVQGEGDLDPRLITIWDKFIGEDDRGAVDYPPDEDKKAADSPPEKDKKE